jgi:hypothetical protein
LPQNEFKLLLDCPGVDAEGLNIECEGNVLRVRRVSSRAGKALPFADSSDAPAPRCSCETKRDEDEARNAKWHRWERAGNMCVCSCHCDCRCVALTCAPPPLSPDRTATRSLRFPDSADMSKVDAKLDNGVLCVWCAASGVCAHHLSFCAVLSPSALLPRLAASASAPSRSRAGCPSRAGTWRSASAWRLSSPSSVAR